MGETCKAFFYLKH